MRLSRKLDAWRQAGLLTDEQSRAISAFEEAQHGTAGSWVVAGLGAIGGLAVVAGLISLIAANWSEIPAALKLFAGLLVLTGSLVAALRLGRDGRTLASDILLFAHAGLVLAVIGLVGQIYHLSGAPWRALALATALAIPAAIVAERSVNTDVAIALALGTLGLFIDRSSWQTWLEGFGLPLLAGSIGCAFWLAADAVRTRHAPAAASLTRWGAALLAVVALTSAVAWSAGWRRATATPMIAIAAVAALIWIVRLALARNLPAVIAAVAQAALCLGAAFLQSGTSAVGLRFLGFALFCIAGGGYAIAAAQSGSKRLTNLFTFAIAARIAALFLELLSSLALTGFGLMLTGVVFCGVAYAWWKLRDAVPVQPRPAAGGAK